MTNLNQKRLDAVIERYQTIPFAAAKRARQRLTHEILRMGQECNFDTMSEEDGQYYEAMECIFRIAVLLHDPTRNEYGDSLSERPKTD